MWPAIARVCPSTAGAEISGRFPKLFFWQVQFPDPFCEKASQIKEAVCLPLQCQKDSHEGEISKLSCQRQRREDGNYFQTVFLQVQGEAFTAPLLWSSSLPDSGQLLKLCRLTHEQKIILKFFLTKKCFTLSCQIVTRSQERIKCVLAHEEVRLHFDGTACTLSLKQTEHLEEQHNLFPNERMRRTFGFNLSISRRFKILLASCSFLRKENTRSTSQNIRSWWYAALPGI